MSQRDYRKGAGRRSRGSGAGFSGWTGLAIGLAIGLCVAGGVWHFKSRPPADPAVTKPKKPAPLSARDEAPDTREPTESGVLRDERVRAVREAFDSVDERCRQLLALAAQVPPLSYGDISELMAMPISAIGPTRGRCLEKLRRHRSIRELMDKNG